MKKSEHKRFSTINGTVESFISDGFAEIQSVGEEFREIYDNAPENLQQTDLNQTRDSTASEIESLSEPSVESSILGELDCTAQIDNGKLYRGRVSQSRACRAANGGNQLRAAAEAIQSWLDEHGEVEVKEDSDQPGKWVFTVNGEGSDTSYDTEDAAKEALAAAIGYDIDDYEQAREEGERLVGELEEIADTVDGLEYPGMFG